MKADFFISYNHNDERNATWAAEILERNGYKVIIQAWDFNAGDNLVANIDEALKNADRLLVILSKSYMDSAWCRVEWTAAFHESILNARSLIVPVRVEDFVVEGVLRPLIYIDLVNKDGEAAASELLSGISTDKPRASQGFPTHYKVEYDSIVNRYFIYDDKIVYSKSVKAMLNDGGFDRLHSRITWYPDEDVSVVSKTPGCSIEVLDEKDTNFNFNVKFDKPFRVGEIVAYEICATLTNQNRHFKNFVSTQVIAPVRFLEVSVQFDKSFLDTYGVSEIETRKIFDSLMSHRTEPPRPHDFANPFHWAVDNPELHFDYQISW